MSRWFTNKIFLGVIIFIAFVVLFVPTITQELITRIAHSQAEELLASKVEIGNAQLHLLSGSVVISGLKVYNPLREEETYIEANSIRLSLAYSPLIFNQLLQIKLTIEDPKFIYETDRSGNWILSKKIPLMRRGKKEEEGRLPVFNVEKIVISDGEVEYRDGKVTRTPTVTYLDDIDVKVTKVRLPTEDDPLPSEFDVDFVINDSGKFEMEGEADFLSPKVSFIADIKLKQLDMPPLAPYYDSRSIPVRIKRGRLAMTSHAVCKKDYLKAPATASISRLEVEPKGKNFMGMPAKSVVEGMKDKDGKLNIDMVITGNIRNPQFHITSSMSKAFASAFTQALAQEARENLGGAVQDTGKGLGEKLKGLFGK